MDVLPPDTALTKLSAATRALAEARTLDEVKKIRDIALAAATYARAAKMGLEAQNHAAEVKLRAERKAGEMLAQLERGGGGDRRSDAFQMSNDGHLKSEYRQALDETDTNRQTANRWQTIADMPGETFEQHIVEQQEAGRELTTAGMLRVAQQLRQKEERAQTARNAFNLELQGARYRTIVIDPPWPVQKILRDERPNQDLLDYPTMTIEEIARLPLAELADAEACHLYLWTTHKFLPDALELVQGWGFRYECLMTWVKPTGMTPFSWMYNTEHVLFCRMGNLRLERMGLKLSFEAPVTKHSEKPDIFYELVCQASPRPRLEMFARRPRAGFYVWGNEVNAATA